MKNYDVEISFKTIYANIEAENKKKVIQFVKEQFAEDYNIELYDDEIKIISEQKC